MINRPLSARTRSFLACGGLGGLLFVTVFALLSIMRGGEEVRKATISTMVYGKAGFLQVWNFWISGILFVSFAIGLHHSLVIKEKKIVVAMFTLAGLALFLAGIFQTRSGDGIPFTAWIHHVCALSLFITLPVAGLVMMKSCKEHGHYKMASYTQYSLVGVLSFFVLTMLGIFRVWHLEEIVGLSQRVSIAFGFIWVARLSIFLLRISSK